MSTALLATKLIIPPLRGGLVKRTHLEEKLEAGLDGRIILVTAPAGFGKTSLIANWVRRLHAGQTAWLSLDDSDNDPVRFWSYLIAALQTLHPGLGSEAISLFMSTRSLPAEAALTALVNDLNTQAPILLVLDDLHLISSAEVQRGLAFLVEHQPEAFKLIIATRSDPQLPLARLRARQQCTEIRLAELRFSDEETASFLRQRLGPDLPAKQIAALAGRTEGWIAGLQMAALSLQSASDPAAFIRDFTGSNRYVLDYLLEEVLRREKDETQNFLLQTSCLRRLCAPLCDTLTGRSDGQAMLERLEAENLFLIPLDAERRWYRYHPLFADLLARQMQDAQPDLLPGLHQRAAGWYAQNGDDAAAVEHALAGQAFEQAATLVEHACFTLLARSEIATLVSWMRSLPDGTIRTHPWLCVLDAWLLILTGQAGTIEARLQSAEALFSGLPVAEATRLQGYAAAIRAQICFIQGAAPLAVQHARVALERLASTDYVISATTATILGAAYSYGGDLTSAVAAFEKAKAISLANGNQFNAIIASSALAQITAARGRLHDAHQIYCDGMHLMGNVHLLAPGYAYVGLADILREWNDLPAALENAQKGVEICELLGQADILMTGYTILARVQRGQGHYSTAQATLEKARRVASEISAWSLDTVLLQQARLALAVGDVLSAKRWAQESSYQPDEPLAFHREAGLLTLARVLTAQGEFDQAEVLLERLQRAAADSGRYAGEIESCLLRAINFNAQGQASRARTVLERALSLSEPEGFTRIYLDEGEAAVALIRGLAPSSALAGRIASPVPASVTALIEPLSNRELDVLRLLAAGLSNPEIAERLYISLNTVKAHVKSIFAKLGVHNRSQALLRAQELNKNYPP
ncbi:MAG TPA: LuxR C-terminal-related transcriptional regulator [Anaerolineales bacterium]|nr:LuxR C-terminal-related transcriptional regulator [Anaerolineales bacterium]